MLTALVAAALTAKAEATYDTSAVTVPVGGNSFAGSYAFTFKISDLSSSSITNKTDILTYWGSANKDAANSVNSFYFQVETPAEGTPTYTLRVASGKLASNSNTAAYSSDGGDGYKTNIINSNTGTLRLREDVVYSVIVVGANQRQDVYITDGTNTASAYYNGNMNGSQPATMGTRFNTAFAATTDSSTWTGEASDGEWGTAGNWDNAFATNNNVVFGSTSETQTIHVAEAGVSVNEMTISGQYTYTGGTITAHLLRIDGDTATFSGSLLADSILLTNRANLTLTTSQFTTVTKTIGMDSTSSLTLTAEADFTLTKAYAGKVAGGTLKLTGGHTFKQIHEGADARYSSKLNIDRGTTLALQSDYKYHETLSGGLAGAGTLQSLAPTQNEQWDGFKKTTITGDTSEFTGTWELETKQYTKEENTNGNTITTTGNKRVMGVLNGTNNTFDGVVSFTGTGTAYVNGNAQTQQSMLVLAKDYSLGGLKSASQLRDVMVMGGAANIDPGASDIHNTAGTARTLTITGNNADDATFSGIIHQSITLKIAANASQAFKNATLNGDITVKTGGQLVSSGSTLGTGATLTVENGAKVKEQVANITLGNNTSQVIRNEESVSQVTWDEGSVYTLTGAGNDKEINLTETASETEGVIHLASGIRKVELNGVSAVALTAGTINRDLLINNNGSDAAGIITASGEYTMNGSISGSGNLQWNVAGGDTSKVTFTGSLKDWQPSNPAYPQWCGFVTNDSGKVEVIVAGDLATTEERVVGTAFNNRQAAGTLELTVQRDAEFTNRVDVSSLTVKSGTSKLSGSQALNVSGATTVKEGATLDLARNGNIGTLSGAGTVKSTAGTAAMTVKADFTGALEAVGGNLTLSADGTAIYLQSLTIQGGSTVTATASVSLGSNPTTPTTLTEGASTLPTLTVQAGTGDATFAGNLTLGSTAVTLGQELKVTGSLTLGTGNTLTLTNGMALPVNSSSLTLFYAENVTDWSGPVAADTVFSSISGVTNLQNYTLSYDAGTKALTLSVPEPATATLSLLALVGLAARRRRKG